jgi:hypothetical protein
MTLLAIDPGIDTGWALFNDALLSCGVGNPPEIYRARVVIERPQVYLASKSKGDPNDLITLAIQVGRYWEQYERAGDSVRTFLPREWKGQVPKDIQAGRILAKLSAQEQDVVANYGRMVNKGKHHNMMDAIGLGLFALGRARCGTT